MLRRCKIIFWSTPEDSAEPSSLDGYLGYIATRDGVPRMGEHGLFGDEDNIDLEKAKTDIAAAPGRVWTQIYSLHREDAVRLEYDHSEARNWCGWKAEFQSKCQGLLYGRQ